MHMSYIKMAVLFIGFTLIAIFVLLHTNYKKQINISKCTSVIRENYDDKSLHSDYQRVTSIIANKGFSRETGYSYNDSNKWRLDRFYTFTLTHLSGESYRLTELKQHNEKDNNTPQSVLSRARPELSRSEHLLEIKELKKGVWLFSGIDLPLFVCKEKKM